MRCDSQQITEFLSEFAGDLMKGLTRVMRALMYQAGWTTRSPFKSFFNLNTHQDTNMTAVVMVTRSLLRRLSVRTNIKQSLFFQNKCLHPAWQWRRGKTSDLLSMEV